MSLEELNAEQLFEPPNLVAQCPRGHVQLLRSFGQAQMARGGLERVEALSGGIGLCMRYAQPSGENISIVERFVNGRTWMHENQRLRNIQFGNREIDT